MAENAWCHIDMSSVSNHTEETERGFLMNVAAVRFPGRDVDFTLFDNEAMTGDGRKVTITAPDAKAHMAGKKVTLIRRDTDGSETVQEVDFAA